MAFQIKCIITLLLTIANLHSFALEDVIRFRITHAQNGNSDESIVRFLPNATTSFDGNYDAHKLFSFNDSMPALFSRTAGGVDLAINAYPALDRGYELTMYTRAIGGGSYILSYEVLGAFDPAAIISVRTNSDQQYHSLADFPLTVNLPATQDTLNSFTITFSLPPALVQSQPICAGASDGSLSIIDLGTAGFFYQISDANGVEVASDSSFTDSTFIPGLSAGGYFISILTKAGEQYAYSAIIESLPEAVVTMATIPSKCLEASTGRADVFVSGVGPFDFSWSHDSANANRLRNLAPGMYTITVTDGNGCGYERSRNVGFRTPNIADPELLTEREYRTAGALVSFSNQSALADSSWWVFSDRALMDGADVQRSFGRTGDYHAVLYAVAGECSDVDTVQFNIHDEWALSAEEAEASNLDVRVTMESTQLRLESNENFKNADLSIYDLNGRLIVQRQIAQVSQGIQFIPMPSLSSSNYVVSLRAQNATVTQLVFQP